MRRPGARTGTICCCRCCTVNSSLLLLFPAAPLLQVAAVSRPVVSRSRAVQAQAFFGAFGGSKPAADGAAPSYYICIDCGYIYDQGDFKKAPGSYK